MTEPKLSRRTFLQASAATLAVAPSLVQAAAAETTTVARYVLLRLQQHGASFLFGVPGATCDPLFAATAPGIVQPVITSSDLEAGYAADGYARLKGLSAVAVTYGVGTMSLLTVVGGAYAERSPMVIINGGPSPEDLRLQRELGTFFTHSIGRDKTDLAMFREVTEYAARAERASEVPAVVDAAIKTAVTMKRPVYIEIAKNLWDEKVPVPKTPLDVTVPPSGQEAPLARAIIEKLRTAQRPALLLGIEVQRYGLQDEVAALLEKLQLPFATTLLAKNVVADDTPGFVGVYGGERAVPHTKKLIEASDALLALGCVMGRQHRKLVTQSFGTMMNAANGALRIGKAAPAKAVLGALVSELRRQEWKPDPARVAATKLPGLSFDERRASLGVGKDEPGLSYDQVMREVSAALDDELLVITDTSLSMYPAADLHIRGRGGFLCNAVWQAIGYSAGAAVGVAMAQQRRPLVICGDGGFQMTAQSLSTLARRNLRAIIVVLDNGHYGIEQWLLDPTFYKSASAQPRPYLALNRWDYPALAKALGVPWARAVDSAAAFKKALAEAKAATGPALISATLNVKDLPSQLRAS